MAASKKSSSKGSSKKSKSDRSGSGKSKAAKKVTYQDKPWLSHYDAGVPASIKYENLCLPEFFERTVSRYPDRMALSFQGYKVNYSQLKDMSDRVAACLRGFGVKKGDSVAILLPNLIHCVAAYYAVLKIGGIVVMNNPLYTDRELEHQFNDSGSKVLITLDLLGNRMIDLRPKTKIKQIIYGSIGDYLPFPKSILFPLVAKKEKLAADVKQAPDVYKWKEIVASHKPEPCIEKSVFSDVAMFQYTGGTTGVSKGAMLTHGNLSKQVQQLSAWFPKFAKNNEIMLSALPFFHVFGLSTAMNLSVCSGWGQVLIPRPQPEQLLEAIKKFKPTFAPLVPTMYIGILNHPGIGKVDLTSLKGCFSGSAPLPVEVIREFEEKTGAVIVEGFGLTESSPVTHVNPFEGRRKIGSIGIPVSDTECRIVDLDTGKKDMPVGESGELIIKGPQVMKGYRNMKEETDNSIRGGWLFTGDIATMDEDGYFYIVDRKKDMIISGGYNIYPRDVDEVLFEHPKVLEACAIGIPHPSRGEQVKAFVVLREGVTATEQEILDYCKTKLAAYKLPTQVEFRKELPKSMVGKILRKELKAQELQRTSKK